MVKRTKIVIPFNYDESWIGGIYYIKNIISSLNMLEDNVKPYLYILSNEKKSFDFLVRETGYKYMEHVSSLSFLGYDSNKSRKWKLFQSLIPRFIKSEKNFDVVFPSPVNSNFRKTICWIPDFQDKHLPELFSENELEVRTKQHIDYQTNYDDIVFSSQAALADFETFYPDAKVATHVVRFASFNNIENLMSKDSLIEKYNLPESYVYCPNQFWIHKNHKVVIDAVAKVIDSGINVNVVFSGKEHDHRNPNHVNELKKRVEILGLSENIHFLGFLPREDQLSLMKNASFIMQPSLFEGWSTVIEDAKVFSKFILASDLPVHSEQLEENYLLFKRDSSEDLAIKMASLIQSPPKVVDINYSIYQKRFALDFISMVDTIKRRGN
ncbi:glycosyltransferase [Vibrio fluvialis]|nr:glycosyltransferase [Vibrio fluvialis]